MADDRLVLSGRLNVAVDHRDWPHAHQLLERMRGGDDAAQFAFGGRPAPVGCYSIFIARLQGQQPTDADPAFAEARELLSRKVANSPTNAPAQALLLGNLAVVDGLLGRKHASLTDANPSSRLVRVR